MGDREAQHGVHLPADRAFVVQFAAGPVDIAGGHGRVEHLASGEVTRFESLALLEEFFARVLGEVRA
jgi:hypothetical protein